MHHSHHKSHANAALWEGEYCRRSLGVGLRACHQILLYVDPREVATPPDKVISPQSSNLSPPKIVGDGFSAVIDMNDVHDLLLRLA